jgi:FkbM family methyltransferase
MSGLPVISIVVPSFNQGRFIGETLTSLVNQNYPNLELIVIDGGSTDNSADVIRSFEKHIKYWVSEKDSGQTSAINKGLQHVTGELFNWLNSDDVLEPGALHHLGKLANENPGRNLFIGQTRFFDANGTIRNSTSIVFNKPEMTLGYGQVNQPAMFYRMNVIRAFPLDENLHLCMDLDLWMRYLTANGHANLLETDFCVAGFRFHGDSKTMSSENPFRKERDQLYTRMYESKDANEIVLASQPYFHLWKADELMLQKNYSGSADSLNKVPFNAQEETVMMRAWWEYFKFLIRGLPVPPDRDFHFIKNGMLIFDIGANMGNYAALFAKRGAKVIGFEPQPFCFRFLKLRFMFNSKVSLHALAVGERESKMEMNVSSAHTLSSLNKDWIDKVSASERFKPHGQPSWSEKIQVNVTTLDKLIAAHGIPDYIKIDVEGFEKNVLAGLNRKVKTISFEFTLPELKADAIDCVNKLSSLGTYEYISLNDPSGKKRVNQAELIKEIETISASGELANGDIFAHLVNG